MNELLNKMIDDAREELLVKTTTDEEKEWQNDCDRLNKLLKEADHKERLDRLADDVVGVWRAYFDAGFYAGMEFAKAARTRFV